MIKALVHAGACAAAVIALASCSATGNPNAGEIKSPGAGSGQATDPSGLFAKGHLGSKDFFTGTGWVTALLVRPGIDNIANVAFEPRARTFWHTHPVGQVLIVTEGQGLYQERGKKAQLIKKGDVINTAAHVEHWHGATATTGMTHIAVTNFQGDQLVTWLGPVTDEEFARANTSPQAWITK